MNKHLKLTSMACVAALSLTACNNNSDQSLDLLAKKCWVQYQKDEAGLLTDPKCSNFAVMDKISILSRSVLNNRRCGYPDFYQGTLNLNDLTKLNKKEQQYVKKVADCSEEYLKYAEPGSFGSFRMASYKNVLKELAKNKACNIPAVEERIKVIMEFSRGKIRGDEAFCRK